MYLNNKHINNVNLNKKQSYGINRKQQGSALVIAIFVIIVMTLLGTALVRMLSTEAETIAYEVIGTRAFQAAQSGMQWQLQQVFPLTPLGIPSPIVDCPIAYPTPPDTIEFTNGNDGRGLKNCKAKLSCSSFIHTDGVRYYQLESTGICEVGDIATSRKISVDARSL